MRISDWSSDVCSSDLCVLLFGIINFGLILSFKQDMTRAAAEGARAGAVAVAGQSEADAEIATDEAVREFGDRFTDGCATDGMKTADGSSGCDVRIHNCDGVTYDPDDAITDCVTAELRYDYQSHPQIGRASVRDRGGQDGAIPGGAGT